jgi:phage shock protein E
MNTNDQEKNMALTKKQLYILITVISLIIIGLILFKKEPFHYQISVEEMHARLLKSDHMFTPEQFADAYFGNDSSFRFIDLRSSPEYLEGHIKNAIHIPIHKILEPEYKHIFDQDKKINVLYHYDHCHACGPWMLLTQLGYQNNKILMGGYNYVKQNVIDNFTPLSGNYKDENAKYDYNLIFNQTQGNTNSNTQNSSDNPTVSPVIKKQKKDKSGGGC